jgi:MSP (Major sperm protein) domain
MEYPPFTPLRLDYGGCYLETNHEKTVEVKNIYDKELEFSATTTSDWFSLTNNSGVLKPGESAIININTIPEKINSVDTVYSDTLIVQLGEEKNSIPVKLQTIYPAKVTLSPHPIVCEIGGMLDISTNSFGENGELLSGYEFDWEISDPTIGNLSYNGTLYGKKIGTAEIKATVSPLPESGSPIFGLSDVQVIKIREPIIPSSIDFGEILLCKTQTMELEIKMNHFDL